MELQGWKRRRHSLAKRKMIQVPRSLDFCAFEDLGRDPGGNPVDTSLSLLFIGHRGE